VVFGRFMLPDMTEHACQVIEMGPDSAVFATSEVPPIGLPIVAYLEDLGRVEVISGAPVPGGFRVRYAYTGASNGPMALLTTAAMPVSSPRTSTPT
jgi:hypothetical protein